MTARALPVFPAILKAKLHHTLPQSIISDRDAYEPWFQSNYIQLYCPRGDRGSFHVNFYEYFVWVHPIPAVMAQHLRRETVGIMSSNPIDFIVASIDRGFYFYTYVDEFYLPLFLYQKFHFVHDLLIYGYDLEIRQFDVVGKTEANQFGTAKISFEQFLESYDESHITADYQRDIFLLSERQSEHRHYRFDPVLVRELLTDYIESRNTSERLRMYSNPLDWHFGIDVFNRYIADMELAKETGEIISYLPVHTLFEHKACMTSRFEYMSRNGFADAARLEPLTDKYRRHVLHGANVLRSMILKRHTAKTDPTVDQLIAKIHGIVAAEREILPEVLEVLKP
ncbi:hypothetical protein B5M42_013000 [Paenibacillus athensensis]|uniref:Butirosin biosynthesis protein H N-terminal domain-containing protein n=1 Tax=Paenibacillus athensensis TaxID=1967502 RepID=A0A4Y8Q6E1_9BACL|nr:hypothetical protein [Paenibacillus athensensis]MCD1259752.1 hypothetical protein [Paenibacillus athensensis]